MTKNKYELLEWVVKTAKAKGADNVETGIVKQRKVNVEFRDKQLDKIKETTENSLSLDVYVDNRYSGHSTNDLRKETLETFIEEAVAATKYLSEDPYRKLLEAKYYPESMDKDLKLVDKNYEKVNPKQRLAIAREIEKVATGISDKVISCAGGYSDHKYSITRMNSNGFKGSSEGTFFSANAYVTARDANARPEAYNGASSRFFNKLPEPEEIGKKATEMALKKIGQAKIESGKYTMLVENRTLGRLLYMLIGPMYARSLQQKRSYLDGMLNKKIASDKLTMIDDPLLKSGLGSRLFESNGLAAQKRTMIEKGVLKNYYVDDYYGRKLEMEFTSGSPSNLIFDTGKHSLNEMIKSIDKGILVTSFNGGNSNSTTGDFSFGIAGQLIEKGIITRPVSEMNISGNALSFWNQLVENGNDVYTYSSWLRPSMMFEDIDFSGL